MKALVPFMFLLQSEGALVGGGSSASSDNALLCSSEVGHDHSMPKCDMCVLLQETAIVSKGKKAKQKRDRRGDSLGYLTLDKGSLGLNNLNHPRERDMCQAASESLPFTSQTPRATTHQPTSQPAFPSRLFLPGPK